MLKVELQLFINENYEFSCSPFLYGTHTFEPEDFQKNVEQTIIDASFGRTLMKILRYKNMNPVEVYKKARIDRKLFSKIRTKSQYVPSKKTIIALSLGAELNYDETQALLSVAGLTLSHYILFDVIIEFYIKNQIYDIDAINISLNEYKQPVI